MKLRDLVLSCAALAALGSLTARGADLVVIDARGLQVQPGQ